MGPTNGKWSEKVWEPLAYSAYAAEQRKTKFAAILRSPTIDLILKCVVFHPPTPPTLSDMHASDIAEQHTWTTEITAVIRLFKRDVNSRMLTIIVFNRQYAAPAINRVDYSLYIRIQ